ncbi:unnamed protein product [Paramecium pentaurelia]|uniref:Uncharacterized protein n=1 Tax=Paramecium pentaurelia TaxID=43138 RepID=A0A8S1SGS8_9CILI|nr:unnamed protein product [Paramecium pentaurelia]
MRQISSALQLKTNCNQEKLLESAGQYKLVDSKSINQ